jgi:hypothetical protein
MDANKVSFTVVEGHSSFTAAIIRMAKSLSDASWANYMQTTDSIFGALLIALQGPRSRYNAAAPLHKVFTLPEVNKITRNMGLCNHAIAAGSTVMDAFLTELGIPVQTVGANQLRFFPHDSHKRVVNREGPVRTFIEDMLATDVPARFTCMTLEKAFASVAKKGQTPTADKLPFEAFQYGAEHPLGLSCLVDLHPPTRRRACRVPISTLCSELDRAFRASDDRIIAKQIIASSSKGVHPVVEVSIPCPKCTGDSKHSIHLPFNAFCSFMTQVNKEKEVAKLAARPVQGLLAFAEEEELDIVARYNRIRSAAAKRNSMLLPFTCPNAECKCSSEPRFFEHSPECKGCVETAKSGGLSHFHQMRCIDCTTVACGLCSKPKSAHIGERELCPREKRVTAEERAEARKEGNLFCPCCETAIQWMDGCPHLTCGACQFHFCGNCEQNLPVDPRTGSRYTHVCPNPGRANAYFHTAAQAAGGVVYIPHGHREHNPAITHAIFDSRKLVPNRTRDRARAIARARDQVRAIARAHIRARAHDDVVPAAAFVDQLRGANVAFAAALRNQHAGDNRRFAIQLQLPVGGVAADGPAAALAFFAQIRAGGGAALPAAGGGGAALPAAGGAALPAAGGGGAALPAADNLDELLARQLQDEEDGN